MLREQAYLKILTAGLYIAPLAIFLYLKHTIFPLVTLKVFTFHIVVELLLALWVFFVVVFPHYRPKLSTLTYLVIGFFTALTLSSVIGVDAVRSFWSVPGRAIGLFSLFHYFGFFLILISLAKHINWRRYLTFLFGISIIVSTSAVLQRFVPGILLVEGVTTRVGGFLGNPSFLASYLLFTIFLGAWLARISTRKIVRYALWLGVVFEVFTIFLAGTRGAILGLLIGFFVFLLLESIRSFKSHSSKTLARNVPLVILVAMILFGGVFWGTRSASVWQSVPGLDRVATISLDDITTKNRLIAWQIAWESFQERPLFGWGWENYKYAFDTNYNPRILETGFGETFWDKPHNTFLEHLTTGGIIGFVFYLSLFIWPILLLLRNSGTVFRSFGIALLVAHAISSFFVFDTFGSYLMFFVVLAFIYSLSESNSEALHAMSETASFSGGRGVLGIALIAAALFGAYTNIQIVRANNFQYHGLNFFLNAAPEEALTSYYRAVEIKEPYQDEITLSFLGALSDASRALEIPGIHEHIGTVVSMSEDVVRDSIDYRSHIRLAEARISFGTIDPVYLEGFDGNLIKAIELSPTRQENYYVLSEARLQILGDQVGAYEAMEAAVQLDPEVGEPHFFFGLLAFQVGDVERALEEIKIAEELGRTPQNGNEHRILANYYGDIGDFEKSIENYQAALQSNPLDTEARLKLGIVRYYTGAFGEARSLFERVFQERPDFIGTPNFLELEPIFEEVGALESL